ncbi:MAG: peptide-methionine (R)-S-oxide reductase MsrB [Bacteroidetes bacterium]|nr:peptide-methionine (R)-S-oxide reductase MsrB [Bacteroidota bacterium]
MFKFVPTLLFIVMAGLSASCQNPTNNKNNQALMENQNQTKNPYYSRTDTSKLNVSDAEWEKVLSEEVYYISRNKGTERAFTGKLWDFEGTGTYYCAACGNALFKSDSKFGSSCGWPSFYQAMSANSVAYHSDNTFGMVRIEVVCGRCAGHLGHIFDDGPPPTGKRFCMNSVVLDFEPDSEKAK